MRLSLRLVNDSSVSAWPMQYMSELAIAYSRALSIGPGGWAEPETEDYKGQGSCASKLQQDT